MISKPGTKRQAQVMDAIVEAGYKLTKPRIEVVSCLLDGQHAHTAEEIGRHLSISTKKRTVNMRTVYSVLSLLKDLNLVHEYFINGKHRFELTAGNSDHIHLVDDEQDSLETMEIDADLRKALEKTARKNGFQIKDVQISMHVTREGKR